MSFSQEIQKIRIDPSSAYGGTASEYFSKIEYIPLESTKESLFGDVTQLIITDSSIIIYDWDTRSTLFFTPGGKYITRIRGKENMYSNINYEQASHRVTVSTYNPYTYNVELKYYSSTGQPLKIKPLTLKSMEERNMLPLGDGYYVTTRNCLIRPGKTPVDSTVGLVEIYKNNQLHKSMLPCNQQKDMSFCTLMGWLRLGKVVQNNSVYVSTPLRHEVYKVSRDTAVKMFQFVFPGNRSFSGQILDSHDKTLLNNIRDQISNDITKVMDVSNIFFNKNLLFFKINTRVYISKAGTDNTSIYNFIYDTTSGRLSALERITADASNFFLPLFDYRVSVFGLEYYNENFYSSISSLKMFTERDKTADRHPVYPKNLEEYFKTQDRKSNPVIVKMKLK
ncbi:6-bladed beta-propeller [Chitinophaga sp. Ak27]|uniref:6-bladed beta-propeller n=1 Tax=Chitinophaga sp. Ak27 TaxID=2726116 RepID=UPI00145CECA7|nr:6-bladed beta-propeller [Chitinophaga sp. Ak27]NLU90891.1 6-bladed beta-propeller [Chitinophaga sp. Ak27]